MANDLTEQPGFTLGTNGSRLRIPWSIMIHVATTVIALAVGWGTVTSKLDSQALRITVLENQHVADTLFMQDLRAQLVVAAQKLTDFKDDYNRDANRYIRDANDKRH